MPASQMNSGQLEDRLRGLIINNANQEATRAPQTPGTPISTESNPSDGQSKIKKGQQKTKQGSPAAQTPSRGGKKRPNQAQRRQMQAQLSIPIDTRPPVQSHGHASPHWRNGEQSEFYPLMNIYNTVPSNPYPLYQPHYQGRLSQELTYPTDHNRSWRQQQQRQQPRSFDALTDRIDTSSLDASSPRDRQGPQPYLYYSSDQRQFFFSPEQLANQCGLLDRLCQFVVAGAEIEPEDIAEKENFRSRVEMICRDAISRYEIETNGNSAFHPYTVELKCFGSLSSGFATKAADMDLGLLSPMSWPSLDSADSPIPRLVEKALLESGFGARLLTRTRVPIIKLCEKPSEELRLALLEERARWEAGLADDMHDAVEDITNDQDMLERPVDFAVTKLDHLPSSNQRQSSHQPMGKAYEEQLNSLKQTESQSLMGYYGNAKRLLRRLNGRDITISNAVDFKPEDYKLLDSVASSFVNGLHDETLKRRVQSYPSFHSSTTSNQPNLRSLVGALMMVEGEQLVMAWETQTMDGDFSKLKLNSENVVQAWKNLQSKRAFGTDPLSFNRELNLAIERLRQIPLMQLMQLKQDQYESPMQYYARVARIMADLSSSHPSLSTTLLPQVTKNYISGIRDKHMRDEVDSFVTSTSTQNLRTIARKHTAVHLATDYERAIEKGLYPEEDIPVIKEYVEILREDLVCRVQPVDRRAIERTEFMIPTTRRITAVVDKVRQLPDPSKLAPNQPRDRYHDSLEFPKNGIGVQCDINFSAQLALQNTLLLRCYSYTDPRVKPMVLFVKYWAKVRGINTPYRGTLSSYGYVLMVLHYLVNIAEPFVCPNLQHLVPPHQNPAEAIEGVTICKGLDVRFWRDEEEIRRLALQGCLNQNRESLGSLLRGFFEYYAQSNMMSTSKTRQRGFDWGRDVLSLRTYKGLCSKQAKGWTGAKTVVQYETGALPNPQSGQPTSPDGAPVPQMRAKEVRNRYLFAIEDPFEHDHNVARTVTHNGIVSIRDEFRRAWRIIKSAGANGQATEDLLQNVKEETTKTEKKQFEELLKELHGSDMFPNMATA